MFDTDNMNTAITNKQRREISHLEYVFISRQVRGNRLLIAISMESFINARENRTYRSKDLPR